MTEKQVFKTTWGGRPLEVEIGQLAKQANGAVLVRYGDTVVLISEERGVGEECVRPNFDIGGGGFS